jgi:hypothetical protein
MSALVPSLIDGNGFPSVPGFPELPGFNAQDPPDSPSGDRGGDGHGGKGHGDDGHDGAYGRPWRDRPAEAKPAGHAPVHRKHTRRKALQTGPNGPDVPGKPEEPAAWNGRPACHERGKCGARPSHHHRPDLTDRDRRDLVGRRAVRSDRRTVQIDRSPDRSAHRRRSSVTERPQNTRTIRVHANGSGYHTRRSIPEARSPESRAEDNQNRSYRGNHRAAGQHHLDHQAPAQQRSSRVGRHHADASDDYLNR